MALPWAIAVLTLLPLLEAQSPACANLTAKPITNATLDWLSGRWFYIGSTFRDSQFRQSVEKVQVSFFYFTPNLTEDTILLQQYMSTEGKCVYNTSIIKVQRENGTLSLVDGRTEHVAHLLLLPRNPRTYVLAFSLDDDEKKWGMSFYAEKPEATPEQLEEFHEALACKGMNKSEVMYTDWKKDLCQPLRKQHELARAAEKEEP